MEDSDDGSVITFGDLPQAAADHAEEDLATVLSWEIDELVADWLGSSGTGRSIVDVLLQQVDAGSLSQQVLDQRHSFGRMIGSISVHADALQDVAQKLARLNRPLNMEEFEPLACVVGWRVMVIDCAADELRKYCARPPSTSGQAQGLSLNDVSKLLDVFIEYSVKALIAACAKWLPHDTEFCSPVGDEQGANLFIEHHGLGNSVAAVPAKPANPGPPRNDRIGPTVPGDTVAGTSGNRPSRPRKRDRSRKRDTPRAPVRDRPGVRATVPPHPGRRATKAQGGGNIRPSKIPTNSVHVAPPASVPSGQLTDEENDRLNNEAIGQIKANSPGFFGLGAAIKPQKRGFFGIPIGTVPTRLYIRTGNSPECLPSGTYVRGMISVSRKNNAKERQKFLPEGKRRSTSATAESYQFTFAGKLNDRGKDFVRNAFVKLGNAKDVTLKFKKPRA